MTNKLGEVADLTAAGQLAHGGVKIRDIANPATIREASSLPKKSARHARLLFASE